MPKIALSGSLSSDESATKEVNLKESTPSHQPFAAQNPFRKFFGEWTLKNNTFKQVWDGKTTQTLTIENHYTHCAAINTSQSVLCVIDAGGLKGHILWTYDTAKNQVHHLSHFGDARNGVGSGTLNKNADLTTKVSFQGEPTGSYRIYEYKWINDREYTMMSRQYDAQNKPTGNWYGGTFIVLTAAVQE